VLGFTSKMYMPEAYMAIVVSPEDKDGTGLLLEPNNNPIAKTYQEALYNSGIPCIVFGTGDIYAEYDSLKAKVWYSKSHLKKQNGASGQYSKTAVAIIYNWHRYNNIRTPYMRGSYIKRYCYF
jgi:hypothetical protein